jgi:hypothetical protein
MNCNYGIVDLDSRSMVQIQEQNVENSKRQNVVPNRTSTPIQSIIKGTHSFQPIIPLLSRLFITTQSVYVSSTSMRRSSKQPVSRKQNPQPPTPPSTTAATDGQDTCGGLHSQPSDTKTERTAAWVNAKDGPWNIETAKSKTSK